MPITISQVDFWNIATSDANPSARMVVSPRHLSLDGHRRPQVASVQVNTRPSGGSVMLRAPIRVSPLVGILGTIALGLTALAEPPQDKFQRAFFLQEHKGDLAAAEKLYAEVAA